MTSHPEKPLTEYDFFQKLIELPFVEAIYLYGSRGRGDTHARADIDLAILCPEATKEEWSQAHRIVKEANVLLPIDISRLDDLPHNARVTGRIIMELKPLFIRQHNVQRDVVYENVERTRWLLKLFKDALQIASRSEENQARAVANFNLCFFTFWRVLRRALILSGMRPYSPLSTLRQAFAEGILNDRMLWEELYDNWNRLLPGPTAEHARQFMPKLSLYHDTLSAGADALAKYMEHYHPRAAASAGQPTLLRPTTVKPSD